MPKAHRGRFVLLGLAAAALVWVLAPAVRVGADDKDTTAAKAKGPLHELMEGVNDSFRKLRREVRKADKNAECLELIVQIQTSIIKAKSLTPPQLAKIPEAKRAEAARNFRLHMIDLLGELLKAEKALIESRNTDAYDAVKKMSVIKAECHEALGVD